MFEFTNKFFINGNALDNVSVYLNTKNRQLDKFTLNLNLLNANTLLPVSSNINLKMGARFNLIATSDLIDSLLAVGDTSSSLSNLGTNFNSSPLPNVVLKGYMKLLHANGGNGLSGLTTGAVKNHLHLTHSLTDAKEIGFSSQPVIVSTASATSGWTKTLVSTNLVGIRPLFQSIDRLYQKLAAIQGRVDATWANVTDVNNSLYDGYWIGNNFMDDVRNIHVVSDPNSDWGVNLFDDNSQGNLIYRNNFKDKFTTLKSDDLFATPGVYKSNEEIFNILKPQIMAGRRLDDIYPIVETMIDNLSTETYFNDAQRQEILKIYSGTKIRNLASDFTIPGTSTLGGAQPVKYKIKLSSATAAGAHLSLESLLLTPNPTTLVEFYKFDSGNGYQPSSWSDMVNDLNNSTCNGGIQFSDNHHCLKYFLLAEFFEHDSDFATKRTLTFGMLPEFVFGAEGIDINLRGFHFNKIGLELSSPVFDWLVQNLINNVKYSLISPSVYFQRIPGKGAASVGHFNTLVSSLLGVNKDDSLNNIWSRNGGALRDGDMAGYIPNIVSNESWSILNDAFTKNLKANIFVDFKQPLFNMITSLGIVFNYTDTSVGFSLKTVYQNINLI